MLHLAQRANGILYPQGHDETLLHHKGKRINRAIASEGYARVKLTHDDHERWLEGCMLRESDKIVQEGKKLRTYFILYCTSLVRTYRN